MRHPGVEQRAQPRVGPRRGGDRAALGHGVRVPDVAGLAAAHHHEVGHLRVQHRVLRDGRGVQRPVQVAGRLVQLHRVHAGPRGGRQVLADQAVQGTLHPVRGVEPADRVQHPVGLPDTDLGHRHPAQPLVDLDQLGERFAQPCHVGQAEPAVLRQGRHDDAHRRSGGEAQHLASLHRRLRRRLARGHARAVRGRFGAPGRDDRGLAARHEAEIQDGPAQHLLQRAPVDRPGPLDGPVEQQPDVPVGGFAPLAGRLLDGVVEQVGQFLFGQAQLGDAGGEGGVAGMRHWHPPVIDTLLCTDLGRRTQPLPRGRCLPAGC